jgi:hypothetical protein
LPWSAIDRVFAQDHAAELALVRQRHVQLQQARAVGARHRLRIDRLLQVARQAVHGFGFARAQHVALGAHVHAAQAGRGIRREHAAALVDPGEHQQLGVLRDHRLGAADELLGIHFAVRDVARDAHQLFLPLQQAQPHALLRVFDVALDRFLLAVHFLQPQVPEGGDDRRQEQQHRGERRQHGVAVLAGGSLAAPPVPPPVRGGHLGTQLRMGEITHEYC